MPHSFVRRSGWMILLLATAVLVTFLSAPLLQLPAAQPSGGYELVRPLLFSTASAEDAQIAAFIDTEAGVSAYFQAPGALSLTNVRTLYRTIEVETDSYILGSIPVPNYVSESEDVHVYVHKDGWVLAYYLAATPAANLIDWARFQNNVIVTKFDTVFKLLADHMAFTLPAITYYDFRYPNSNYLLLIAEESDLTDSFSVFLNETVQYEERSWTLSSENEAAEYKLNNVQVLQSDFANAPKWSDATGTFTALQLPVNATHTIAVTRTTCCTSRVFAGLALVYRRS
jgi:hypothetical protein